MKNLKITEINLCMVFILAGCFVSKSDIKEINSFKDVESILNHVNAQTLVIFDIDETLTVPDHIIFQKWFNETSQAKVFWEEIKKHIDAQENPKEYVKRITALSLRDCAIRIIEPIIVETIKNLQDRGIKTIALTAFNTGSMGGDIIPSLPRWRYEKLKEAGIDFSKGFGDKEIAFEHLTSPAHRHPIFYKGILLTDAFTKGQVLGTFLDRINWKPDKIIFFDDTLKHLESVQAEMKKRKLPFEGFLYKGGNYLAKPINQKVLDIQLQHLKEHNEYISDKEVQKNL